MNRSYNILFILLLIIANQPLAAQWVLQGPSPSNEGQVEGITNRPIAGAINCVTPHPSDADILYIGSVNGGVWKSTNATSLPPSWIFISDDISSQSIGALEFDPTDASNLTLVVANGYTSSISRRGSGQMGIFKTTTGIGPWTNIDTDNELPVNSATGVAPRGDIIVLALGSSGIWRTIDNGDSWTQISGGGLTGLPLGTSWDLISDPADNTILYTTAGTNGIYRSINTGATWVKVSDLAIDALLATASNVELAVGNNNNVYAAVVSASPTDALNGLFRTGNGLAPWTSLDLPTTLEVGVNIGIHPGTQGSLHLSLTADPSDDNVLYIGGDRQPSPRPTSIGATTGSGRLFRVDASLGTGSQSTHITHSSTMNNSSPHADSRDMDFDASGDLIEGDDGGVYKQTSPEDNTGDWFSLNGNLNVAEAHSADWDAFSSIAIVGLQDNGVTQQVTSGNILWANVLRGDGGDIASTDLGAVISSRFSSNQRFLTFRQRNYDAANAQSGATISPALTNSSDGITSIISTDAFGFVTPIKLNSQDGTRILIATNTALYESLDQAETVTSVLNQIVNGASTNSSQSGRDVLIYGAQDNVELICAGVGATVQVRTAAAGAFTPAPGYVGGTVEGITIDPSDSQSLFVIDNNNVYHSLDGGTTFTPITNNLSSINPGQFLSIEYITRGSSTLLALGTDMGVYISSAPNYDYWFELSPDLPQARVEELVYDPGEEVLAAALLGRGLWTYSFEERDPVDVALVLDFSGSMNNSACATCDPKVDVLKEAVEIFLQMWKALAVGDDLITTVYFSNNVDIFDVAGTENLDVIDRTDEIITDINAQIASGGTALGGGLQTAISELSDNTRPRHVVVFTDGMQNVDPGIRYPELDIVDGEFASLSGVVETIPPTELDNLGGIRVHTIGVGATPAFESQLSDIANASTGLTKITTAPDEDLIQFYIEQLIEILRDFSPQLITYRHNKLIGQSIESVDINSSASQVLFKVSYPKDKTVNVKIMHDGKDVTQYAKVTKGKFYQLFHFPFEQLIKFKNINNSEWKAILSNGKQSFDYQFAVVADEHILDYDLGIVDNKFTSGSTIELFTNLKTKNQPFKGDAKVTATIKYPTKSLGNIISKFKMPTKSDFKFEKGSSIGEKKTTLLMNSKNFQQLTNRKEVKLELKRNKNGQFKAKFSNTKICGNYLVEYIIKGKNEETGYFERIETRNFFIRFGKFNRKKSKVKLNKIEGSRYKLSIKPIDRHNNLLGPDQLYKLKLIPQSGKVISQKDIGNGRYEFIIDFYKKSKNFQLNYKNQVWVDTAKN